MILFNATDLRVCWVVAAEYLRTGYSAEVGDMPPGTMNLNVTGIHRYIGATTRHR